MPIGVIEVRLGRSQTVLETSGEDGAIPRRIPLAVGSEHVEPVDRGVELVRRAFDTLDPNAVFEGDGRTVFECCL